VKKAAHLSASEKKKGEVVPFRNRQLSPPGRAMGLSTTQQIYTIYRSVKKEGGLLVAGKKGESGERKGASFHGKEEGAGF